MRSERGCQKREECSTLHVVGPNSHGEVHVCLNEAEG